MNLLNRFILTMWYVNVKGGTVSSKYGWSFILTMWYVNNSAILSVESVIPVLY